MIPIERLHYRLDMKLNKLASNKHQQISQEDKDFALNEARTKLVKKKIDGGVAGSGLDSFRKRYKDLEFLIVEHEIIIPSKIKSPIASYAVDVTKLKQPFFLPVDVYTECSRKECKGRVVVIENIAKHSDVPKYIASTHLQPSFAYQVTFAIISADRFIIYTEDPQGEFKVDKAYISYLRYPKEMCFGGYEDFDGEIKPKADCEFPEHLEDELLEIATEELALNTENEFAAQAASIRAKEGEQ